MFCSTNSNYKQVLFLSMMPFNNNEERLALNIKSTLKERDFCCHLFIHTCSLEGEEVADVEVAVEADHQLQDKALACGKTWICR